MKSLFSMVMAFIAISITTSTYGAAVADTVKTATIKVTGVGCNGDMPVIKKKLLNEEGIDEVTYTNPTKAGEVTFTIKYHPAVITEARIKKLIEASPCCDNPNEYPFKVKAVVQPG